MVFGNDAVLPQRLLAFQTDLSYLLRIIYLVKSLDITIPPMRWERRPSHPKQKIFHPCRDIERLLVKQRILLQV